MDILYLGQTMKLIARKVPYNTLHTRIFYLPDSEITNNLEKINHLATVVEK